MLEREEPIRTITGPDFKTIYANEIHTAATQSDYQLTLFLVTGDEQGVLNVRQAIVIIPHDVRRSLTQSMIRFEQAQGPDDSGQVS